MFNPITALFHQISTGDVVLVLAIVLLGAWLLYQVGRALGIGWWGRLDRYARFMGQIGIVLGMEQAYELTRGRIPHETDAALLNAYRLLDFEWTHGMFIEQRLEHFFLQFQSLMTAVDLFYIIGHVGMTIGALVWLYVWRRQRFGFMRNMLMISTAIALVAFYLYPTAPPRLLWNYGFVDPLQLHHLVGAGGAQPGSYTYDPYAAMPSLHVAYALVATWSLVRAQSSRWVQGLTLVYPVAMAAVVLISANHWVLDVFGAVATVGIARVILFGMEQGFPRLTNLFQGATSSPPGAGAS
ncbi:MAG: phosphatase PAP2 family protein [Chloroflexota bacterium]